MGESIMIAAILKRSTLKAIKRKAGIISVPSSEFACGAIRTPATIEVGIASSNGSLRQIGHICQKRKSAPRTTNHKAWPVQENAPSISGIIDARALRLPCGMKTTLRYSLTQSGCTAKLTTSSAAHAEPKPNRRRRYLGCRRTRGKTDKKWNLQSNRPSAMPAGTSLSCFQKRRDNAMAKNKSGASLASQTPMAAGNEVQTARDR